MEPEQESRATLCEVGRRSWLRGFCNGNEGNFSVRLPDGRILVTPTGLSKGFMSPNQMCLVDMAGRRLDGGQPTSELGLHLAIYRKRADVGAVIHEHPPHATAFACSNLELPERLHPEGVAVLGRVPKLPYVQPGGPAVGETLAAALDAQTCCALLGNHGVVCFHAELMAAYHLLEMLEGYARLAWLTRALGGGRELTDAEAEAVPRYKL